MSFSHSNAMVLDLDPAPAAFSEYHKELMSVLSAASTSISAARTSADPSPDAAATALDDADRDLGEASDLLKSMELETQAYSGQTRATLRKQVATNREAVSRLKNELRAARISVAQQRDDSNRAQLFGGPAGAESQERAQFATTTEQLEKSSELITDSRRHVAETESVGASILEDLQSHRNTIVRARQSLSGVGTGLDQSNSILSTMHRRALVNKIIVYVVLAVISIACLGIIYARVFHPKRQA